MGGSRTIKTLGFLFLAMSVGTLLLFALQTEPVRLGAQPLAVLAPPPTTATGVIYDTRVPIQHIKWRYMVVHSAKALSDRTARGCHFTISATDDGNWQVRATDAWLAQDSGWHIGGLWRDNSIGICVIGDFARSRPSERQFGLLVELTNSLQELCNIPADRVYLHSDLVARSASPGAAFPADRFSKQLLQQATR